MMRRRDGRRHTAVHEAGHAIIGRVLGLDCGAVSIDANRAEMELGYAMIANPNVTLASTCGASGTTAATTNVLLFAVVS